MWKKKLLAVTMCAALTFSACGRVEGDSASSQMTRLNHQTAYKDLDDKYGTTNEVFVRSFYDSNGDGIGDLKGLEEKLDYLNDGDPETNDDMTVDGIWLMPIMPSTTYHKYDVTDYEDIDPEYGTMEDFDQLVKACHDRGMKIYIDLVMNHTSSQHPWFKEASEYLKSLPQGQEADAAECPYLDYYHFSKEKETGYQKLEGSDYYYECRFWSEMPDLNVESDAVRSEFSKITQFWIDHGVDGFRLDAAKEYTSGSVSTNVDDLTWFEDTVKAQKKDIYVVAEVWNGVEEYARYYASGIDSCFDFSFADKDGLITKRASGKKPASTFAPKMVQVTDLLRKYNPNAVDAPFFVNHDMNRAAGYFSGDEAQSQDKIAWAMNFMMSGNAFLYYGEELGMKGSGKDENKRLPMQWGSGDSQGMTTGPEGTDKNIEQPNGALTEQEKDPYSIYSYVREAVQLRSRFPLLARGDVKPVEELSSDTVSVFEKTVPKTLPDGMTEEIKESKPLLICMNLSNQAEEVDLGAFTGELSAVLVINEEEVSLKDGKLILPAYGTAIITLEGEE